MLRKKQNGVANGPRLKQALAGVVGDAMDRREPDPISLDTELA